MFATKEEIFLLLSESLSVRFDKEHTGNPGECKLVVRLLLNGDEISSDFQTVREGE